MAEVVGAIFGIGICVCAVIGCAKCMSDDNEQRNQRVEQREGQDKLISQQKQYGSHQGICAECVGRGYFICPKCKGDMIVITMSIDQPKKVVCDLCDGSGRNLCWKCKGRG